MALRIFSAYLILVFPKHMVLNGAITRNHELWKSLSEISPLPAEREEMLSRIYRQYNGDSATAEALLKQASKSDTRIAEYLNIFILMKEHDGFYTGAGASLDYNINQLLQTNPDDFDLNEMNKYFRTLWIPFPINRTITIANKRTNKFLCFPYYNVMARAYMLRLNNDTCFWILETDSSGIFFRIKHVPRDGYLIVEERTFYDRYSRRVIISTETQLNQDGWQLIPRSAGDLNVQFKNIYWDELLYSNHLNYPSTLPEPKCKGMGSEWVIKPYD